MAPEPRSPFRWLLALVPMALVLAVGIPGGRLVQFALTPASTTSDATIELLVTQGKRPAEIAMELESAGVISDSQSLLLLGRVLRQWPLLKRGEYRLHARMNPLEIFNALKSGVSIRHSVTIREGQNMYEVAAALERAGIASSKTVLELCRDEGFLRKLGLPEPVPTSLEGYLFPDTYQFSRSDSPETVLRTMVRRYREVWTQVRSRYSLQISSLGLNEHQLITLASIIEKETGAPAERPLISSVFHNRLKKRMRLQSDPTTIYGIWEHYAGNIRKQDLRTPTPYNTYTVPALPIGPISNPGRLAIEAAVMPATSDYLFFVSQNDGTHVFTRSYGEHTQAVRKFQLDPKAREGKSWRDLRKNGDQGIKQKEN